MRDVEMAQSAGDATQTSFWYFVHLIVGQVEVLEQRVVEEGVGQETESIV